MFRQWDDEKLTKARRVAVRFAVCIVASHEAKLRLLSHSSRLAAERNGLATRLEWGFPTGSEVNIINTKLQVIYYKYAYC